MLKWEGELGRRSEKGRKGKEKQKREKMETKLLLNKEVKKG